jgi:hypothetical protein
MGGMRAKLEGRAGRNDDQELTAYALELLGLGADEARTITARPLQDVPELASDRITEARPQSAERRKK